MPFRSICIMPAMPRFGGTTPFMLRPRGTMPFMSSYHHSQSRDNQSRMRYSGHKRTSIYCPQAFCPPTHLVSLRTYFSILSFERHISSAIPASVFTKQSREMACVSSSLIRMCNVCSSEQHNMLLQPYRTWSWSVGDDRAWMGMDPDLQLPYYQPPPREDDVYSDDAETIALTDNVFSVTEALLRAMARNRSSNESITYEALLDKLDGHPPAPVRKAKHNARAGLRRGLRKLFCADKLRRLLATLFASSTTPTSA